MGMERWLRLGAVLVCALALGACSDDSGGSDSQSGGTGGAPVGGSAATGSGGSGGTNTGTSGTGGSGSGGTGGTMPTAGANAMVMCDSSVTAETSCGGTTCGTPSMYAPACTISCCTSDNTCGFRAAQMDMTPTDCVEAPTPDPDCPEYTGFVTLPGCCYDGVQCGFISGSMNACVITHPQLTDLADMAGAPCDGSDEDAGMMMSGDAGP